MADRTRERLALFLRETTPTAGLTRLLDIEHAADATEYGERYAGFSHWMLSEGRCESFVAIDNPTGKHV